MILKSLSYFIQALHIMIPPEELEPMVQTVANNFVTDRYSGEVIAVGINTLREIVSRVPLLLEVESLTAIKKLKSCKKLMEKLLKCKKMKL